MVKAGRSKSGRRGNFPDHATIAFVRTCSDCGKRAFITRKAARKAGREVDGNHVSVYPCGEYFHWGHLQPRVVAGQSPLRTPGTLSQRQLEALEKDQ